MKCTQNIEPLMSDKLMTDDFEMLVVAECGEADGSRNIL
jgi:hypothetical protein